MDTNFSKFWEILEDRESWHAAVHGIAESDINERLKNSNSRKFWSLPRGFLPKPSSLSQGEMTTSSFAYWLLLTPDVLYTSGLLPDLFLIVAHTGNTKYGAHRNIQVRLLSRLSCVHLFVAPWTVACQAPLSTGLSRQEYWGGLPLPSPGDLPDPGTEPMSLMSPALAGRFFSGCNWSKVSGQSRQLLVAQQPRGFLSGHNYDLFRILWTGSSCEPTAHHAHLHILSTACTLTACRSPWILPQSTYEEKALFTAGKKKRHVAISLKRINPSRLPWKAFTHLASGRSLA